MNSRKQCSLFYDPNAGNYLIQYRGNFKEEIDKVSYACGAIITNTIGVIAVNENDLSRLRKDVPSIVYVDFRSGAVLQDISPSYADNINNIKINPYLDLTGKGVIVGIIDTGIDYLNPEFIREDGTSRILSIWDQSINEYEHPEFSKPNNDLYIGQRYSNEEINSAILASKNNQDPYAIVPSKDEVGHGTKVAGIIGARGYTSEIQGVAHDC
ncbi:S8 family serine peptidase, partial [Clostridium perfringens]